MIIHSLLDTDHYKLTMGQVIFNQFPRARAHYRFFNRGRTPFPEGFAEALRAQVQQLGELRATAGEIDWLASAVPYFKPTYLEWLAHYRFDPSEVTIRQESGTLEIEIHGPWYRTVLWEVPILALVSELYFTGRRPADDWAERIRAKAERMASAGIHWADFGTRRRFSAAVQDKVNEVMRVYRPHFLGTSNPHLAMKYDLPPIGTYAHEAPMAMQVVVGPGACNSAWMEAWVREYEGELGIALTDTVTSVHFFRHLGRRDARLFEGVRQDSGQPPVIAEMALARYKELGIDPHFKQIIFSDNLTDAKLIALHEQFNNRIRVSGGIGTYLTNDVGHPPLNIVIKLVAADFGHGPVPVVKLSDDPGKHTGEAQRISAARLELGLG
jgi:nicotinate phosphoribosyltransferase